MSLGMPANGNPVAETFERFFESESTSERVRAAEPGGFDPQLWSQLVDLGVPTMRVEEAAGGSGMSLFEACLMMEQAGRRLASAPIAEALCAARLLAQIGGDVAASWSERIASGEAIVTLSLEAGAGRRIVAGGEVASAILWIDGDQVLLSEPAERSSLSNLGGHALAQVTLTENDAVVLAGGENAHGLWEAAVEEWKLLTATALLGLSSEALHKAAQYAQERSAFGVLIGTYQGIAHPLANDIIDVDGGLLFIRRILSALANREADAGAMICQALWWASSVATRSVAHALHTLGGYGLTNEYDMQLYHRRAKAWALVAGDPQRQLTVAGRRQFLGEVAALPDPGHVEETGSMPAHVLALVEETRAFFERTLTPELRAKAHFSFEGHDWGVHKALAQAGLLYPEWPPEWGGRNADGQSIRACLEVWEDYGWTTMPRDVTTMVGRLIMMFGNEDLQRDVLPRVARGEITISLGYTEPSCGSDVFAAKTRAERDGDDWVINGQKMFTSGSEHASYVFLLARTDKNAAKHKGLTLFLVPLDHPGVEIQPVHTFMDERTNATFYSDVRIPDVYQVGEINGGIRVMGAALTLEQGTAAYFRNQRRMIGVVVDWASGKQRNGRPMLEDPDVLRRLARTSAHANIGACHSERVALLSGGDVQDQAYGPANKVFTTETYIVDSADLLDLTSPDSLARDAGDLSVIEESYRHATATSIYAGTSEVLRSMVAERRLGLPRSRA